MNLGFRVGHGHESGGGARRRIGPPPGGGKAKRFGLPVLLHVGVLGSAERNVNPIFHLYDVREQRLPRAAYDRRLRQATNPAPPIASRPSDPVAGTAFPI
jgi:hypothetical protein